MTTEMSPALTALLAHTRGELKDERWTCYACGYSGTVGPGEDPRIGSAQHALEEVVKASREAVGPFDRIEQQEPIVTSLARTIHVEAVGDTDGLVIRIVGITHMPDHIAAFLTANEVERLIAMLKAALGKGPPP